MAEGLEARETARFRLERIHWKRIVSAPARMRLRLKRFSQKKPISARKGSCCARLIRASGNPEIECEGTSDSYH